MPVAIFLAAVLAIGLPSPGEHILPARRHNHMLILSQVYWNGDGPFRMIVDTGAESSSVRPDVAARIGLAPQYRVELVTAAGSSLVPAARATVQVGPVVDREVEVLFSPIAIPGIDGVLGQSWLARHAYRLDYEHRELVLDSTPPADGLHLPFVDSNGRPALRATVDGVPQLLVLDSGASALTLFRPGPPNGPRAALTTHLGAADAVIGTSIVSLGPAWRREFRSATVAGPIGAGLLPAVAFRAVYVSKDQKLVVLSTRR